MLTIFDVILATVSDRPSILFAIKFCALRVPEMVASLVLRVCELIVPENEAFPLASISETVLPD